jgi:hypothetical protein
MLTQAASEELTAINSPADAAMLVQGEMSTLDHEELWVLNLNRRNQVIEITHLYKGSVSSSQVRVGEVFQAAIRLRASSILLAHNHPSSDPTPSPVIWRKSQGYRLNSATGSRAVTQGSLHAGDYLPSGHPVKGASLRFASLRDFALDRGPTCGKVFRLGSDSIKKTWSMMNWSTMHRSQPSQNRAVRNSQ